VRIVVLAKPCAGIRAQRVVLNRGGRRFATKRLNDRCIARFHPRVRRRSTFRAMLELPNEAGTIRSRRLTISSLF
jgi:hypothetical protein